MQRPVRLKYPHKPLIRDHNLITVLDRNANYGSSPVLSMMKSWLTGKIKSPVEVELHKYIITHPRNNLKWITMLFGSLVGISYYFYINMKRDIQDDLEDPGRALIYNRWISFRQREIRFKTFTDFETNWALYLGNPNKKSNVGESSYVFLDDWKKEHLLIRQKERYLKRRNKDLDFINFIDEAEYRLL